VPRGPRVVAAQVHDASDSEALHDDAQLVRIELPRAVEAPGRDFAEVREPEPRRQIEARLAERE
jgi:hypothetical protein